MLRLLPRHSVWVALVLAVLPLASCDRGRASRTWVRQGEPALSETRAIGTLDNAGLDEGSGIVASPSVPGLFWALNDSGNEPALFALSADGHVQGAVRIAGAVNRDWEALGVGPCPGGSCLFIGDVGDNSARRTSVQLYRVREPAAPNGLTTTPVSAFTEVRFADGAHDVEAMYVAPDTSVWFITKRPAKATDGAARPVHLHRLPLAGWQDTTPLPVEDSLPIVPLKDGGLGRDWPTDASLGPADSTGQRRLAVLTYGAVYVFATDPVTGRPWRRIARCALPIRETTSEGISWMADGSLLILSEGIGAVLYSGICR
ncbi:MAG: hypothetical protein K2R93_17030 [Gemmatimonadaceae bacterium]|nr:hypothetical protein [Gemmatimonadaceae bacterium]